MNNIKYVNLKVEMARQDLTIQSLANKIGYSRDRLSRKLSGVSKLNLDEAFLIQHTCFPHLDVPYLFDCSIKSKTKPA